MTEKSRLNIDQVALMAGVSRSVVSRVLNNHPRVSEEARRKVREVVERHHYRPSSVARGLATDRTQEICILAPRRHDDALATGFWTLLHLGISERCIGRGFFVSLSMISAATDAGIHDRILNDRVYDGFILITQEVTETLAPLLQSRRAPVVLLGNDPAYPDVPSIDVDNFDGAYRATRHLIGLGRRRIGVILGPLSIQETIDRRNGYLHALLEAGLAPHDYPVACGFYSERSGYETVRGWLQRRACPEAIFCGSDTIAVGVLLALHEAGVRVPADVSVVGFDDIPAAAYTIPPLTTVHQPIYDKGVAAADLLLDRIAGRTDGPPHVRLPAALVVRSSCGAA